MFFIKFASPAGAFPMRDGLGGAQAGPWSVESLGLRIQLRQLRQLDVEYVEFW